MNKYLIAFLYFSSCALAHAGDLSFSIKDQHGNGVANAVVSVPADADGTPPDFSKRYEMRQKDIQFAPHVIAVPVGAEVFFPNLDRVRHHVYSFSKGNRFELKLYGRQDDRSVKFDKAGMASIGCNIHDEMVGFINVVDTPHVNVTKADGVVAISGLAAVPDKVLVWHPSMGARRGPKEFAVPADGQSLVLALQKQHMH